MRTDCFMKNIISSLLEALIYDKVKSNFLVELVCLFLIGNVSFICLLLNFCLVCFKESFCSLSTLQSYGRNVKLLIGVFFNFQGEFFNLSNVTFRVGELVIL